MKALRSLVAGAVALASLAGSTLPGNTAAFFAWDVVDVASWDVLNVRAYPSSQSAILVGYPAGTALSLTGKCTDGIDLDDINGLPRWKQRQMVRSSWCEVWVDPLGNGNFRTGWVYGKYITPQ